jgi:hypothetical protein
LEQESAGLPKQFITRPALFFCFHVFTFLMTLCIGSILSFFSWKILIATVIAFIIKVIGDMFHHYSWIRIFNQQQLLKWFFPVIHTRAFYCPRCPLRNCGKFQWKPKAK